MDLELRTSACRGSCKLMKMWSTKPVSDLPGWFVNVLHLHRTTKQGCVMLSRQKHYRCSRRLVGQGNSWFEVVQPNMVPRFHCSSMQAAVGLTELSYQIGEVPFNAISYQPYQSFEHEWSAQLFKKIRLQFLQAGFVRISDRSMAHSPSVEI